MAVPVLRQGDVLIASVQSAVTDAELMQLQEELARKVGEARASGVVIDVTVLDVMDSFATRTLRTIAHMTGLRGADCVIVGIRPDVALAMVQLGVTLEDVETGLDLDEGLELLRRRARGDDGG